jgi:hypothetical protein
VVESPKSLSCLIGRLEYLIDMEFRDRVINLRSLEGFVDCTFRFSHIKEVARAAYYEILVTYTLCMFIASI